MGYTYYHASAYPALAAIWTALLALALLWLAMLALTLIGKWFVYKKLGIRPWAVLIPFYSDWMLGTVATPDKRGFIIAKIALDAVFFTGTLLIDLGAVTTLCWLASFACWVPVMHALSVRFAHGWGYVVGLLLAPPVFWLMLARKSEKPLPPTVDAAR